MASMLIQRGPNEKRPLTCRCEPKDEAVSRSTGVAADPTIGVFNCQAATAFPVHAAKRSAGQLSFVSRGRRDFPIPENGEGLTRGPSCGGGRKSRVRAAESCGTKKNPPRERVRVGTVCLLLAAADERESSESEPDEGEGTWLWNLAGIRPFTGIQNCSCDEDSVLRLAAEVNEEGLYEVASVPGNGINVGSCFPRSRLPGPGRERNHSPTT